MILSFLQLLLQHFPFGNVPEESFYADRFILLISNQIRRPLHVKLLSIFPPAEGGKILQYPFLFQLFNNLPAFIRVYVNVLSLCPDYFSREVITKDFRASLINPRKRAVFRRLTLIYSLFQRIQQLSVMPLRLLQLLFESLALRNVSEYSINTDNLAPIVSNQIGRPFHVKLFSNFPLAE